MPLKAGGRGSNPREIDRWTGGVGWITHPQETMQRASHALAIDGAVWLVDPIDAVGIDDLLDGVGPVAGVVVLFEHHRRDAAALADRYDVPVSVPGWMDGVADRIPGRVERIEEHLTGDRYRLIELSTVPLWREAALYDEATRTLVTAEVLGTAEYFRADGERLGLHPARRPFPPRAAFDALAPERVLVGHGAGVMADAGNALNDTLRNARRRLPAAYIGAAKTVLSG